MIENMLQVLMDFPQLPPKLILPFWKFSQLQFWKVAEYEIDLFHEKKKQQLWNECLKTER